MNTRRPFDTGDNQGRLSEESLKATRRCLGLPEDFSGFETTPGRLLVLLMLIVCAIALGMSLSDVPVDFQ